MKAELIYVSDPMCSWCWGFAPVIREIRETFAENFHFSLLAGGLRPGEITPITPEMREYIYHHWQQVQERTGQPFESKLLEETDFVYNTEPAARALVVMKSLAPQHVFDFLEILHESFYANGKNITKAETLTELAKSFQVNEDEFKSHFEDRQFIEATIMDFTQARKLGVNGFPSLVYKNEETVQVITRGFTELPPLRDLLKRLAKNN